MGWGGAETVVDHSFSSLAFVSLLQTPFVDFPGEQDLRKLFLRICKTQYKPVEFAPDFDSVAAIPGEDPAACRNLCASLLKSHPTERLGKYQIDRLT